MYKSTSAALVLALSLAGPAIADDDGDRSRERGRHHDREDIREDWRRHDRDDIWEELREHDRRRDEGWRRHGWHYQGSRSDGWRYYRGHDYRHWRYVPPYHYSTDYGYRSAYELAWRDWMHYGRHDRYWRRYAGHDSGYAYRAGYDAGWRDAAQYYGRGYRPNYWAYDRDGGWYFNFSIAR